jgi:hypothetical protein
LAYLLLIQFPSNVGIASALGGMWTFYIAAALLVLLLDVLSREHRDLREMVKISALAALIILSHTFFLVVLVIVGLLHGVLSLVQRTRRHLLYWDAPALVIGVLGGTAYWLPLVLMRHWLVFAPGTFPPDQSSCCYCCRQVRTPWALNQ